MHADALPDRLYSAGVSPAQSHIPRPTAHEREQGAGGEHKLGGGGEMGDRSVERMKARQMNAPSMFYDLHPTSSTLTKAALERSTTILLGMTATYRQATYPTWRRET